MFLYATGMDSAIRRIKFQEEGKDFFWDVLAKPALPPVTFVYPKENRLCIYVIQHITGFPCVRRSFASSISDPRFLPDEGTCLDRIFQRIGLGWVLFRLDHPPPGVSP